MTAIKIKPLEFSADNYGNALDMGNRSYTYGYKPEAQFVVALSNDHFEATRFLTLGDLRTIREWIDEAIKAGEEAA